MGFFVACLSGLSLNLEALEEKDAVIEAVLLPVGDELVEERAHRGIRHERARARGGAGSDGRVGPRLIHEKALELLNRRAEANSGDVRRALNLVRTAVAQARGDIEKKLKEKRQQQRRGSSRAAALNAASPDEDEDKEGVDEVSLPLVSMAHMKEAFALLKGKGSTSIGDAIEALPFHAQTLLVAAVMRASKNSDSTSSCGGLVSMNGLESSFDKIQRKFGRIGGDKPQVSQLMVQLENSGLVEQQVARTRDSLGKRPRGGSAAMSSNGNVEYKVNICVDDVRSALKEAQPRLFDITFRKT